MGRHTPSAAHAAHAGARGSSSDDSDGSASGADSARGGTRACPSPVGFGSSGGEGGAVGGSGTGGGGSRGLPAEAAARLSELEAALRRLTKVPFTFYHALACKDLFITATTVPGAFTPPCVYQSSCLGLPLHSSAIKSWACGIRNMRLA